MNQTLTKGRALCGEADGSSARFDSIENRRLADACVLLGEDLKASTGKYLACQFFVELLLSVAVYIAVDFFDRDPLLDHPAFS